jgi:hypothetical protein
VTRLLLSEKDTYAGRETGSPRLGLCAGVAAGVVWCMMRLRFLLHCCRRAVHIERIMVRHVSFDCLLLSLHPISQNPPKSTELVPERWIAMAAECCACLFPGIWRRRCLFRSLLILDWAHPLGIDPILNVGMRLAPDSEHGHCWLSLANRAFCEPEGWPGRYGTLFHSDRNVQYWTTLAPAPGRLREIRELVPMEPKK